MLELTFLFAILVGISLVAGYPVYFIYSRVIASVRSNKYGNTGTPIFTMITASISAFPAIR